MAKTFYKTKTYKADHKTFGGKIYFSDFDRRTSLSDIAEKIENDQKFDEQCRKNILKKKTKNPAMTTKNEQKEYKEEQDN